MAATDYFITPTDIGRGVQRFRWEHIIGLLAGVLTAGLVYRFTTLGVEAALFGALLIALMVWRSDPRWLFGAAIGSFGAIIVVSSMWRDVEVLDKPLSERMAVWSFYFLVIGVMLLIVESYWPKDGTFSALQQAAPRAAKNKANLPERVKQRLNRQREAEATQKTTPVQVPSYAATTRTPYELPHNQSHHSHGNHPTNIAEHNRTGQFTGELHGPAANMQQDQRHNAQTSGYVSQAYPQKPAVLPHMAPMALPKRPNPQPIASPFTPTRASAQHVPNMVHQPAVHVPQKVHAPRTVQPQSAGQSPVHAPVTQTNQVRHAQPIHHGPTNSSHVAPAHPVLPSAAPRPQSPPTTHLLDLRAVKPMPSPARMTVAVRSDSPLPSKRRKLVQL